MTGLTRQPVTKDVFKETANDSPIKKQKKSKGPLASVGVTKETRNGLNAMRKIKNLSNIDDLIQVMLEREANELNADEKENYELLKKFM